MTAATLRSDERIGLIAALAAHAGLVAWLVLWRPAPAPLPKVDRVSVTLSEEVGLEATTPEPSADPAPDSGPQPGDSAPPPAAVAAPEPAPPAPVPPRPEPRPLSQPIARVTPQPRPITRPVIRPVTPPPRPVARPAQTPRRDAIADLLAQRTPTARPTARPAARPTGRPVARPTGAPGGRPNANPTARPGAPGFADAFRTGIPGASGAGQAPAKPGPAQVTSMRASINAKVRIPWDRCALDGLDIDKLRARVTFAMDKQGRVTSVRAPVVTGINDANRSQAGRFGECAVNAIKRAGPYGDLPVQFYDHWKEFTLNFSMRAKT